MRGVFRSGIFGGGGTDGSDGVPTTCRKVLSSFFHILTAAPAQGLRVSALRNGTLRDMRAVRQQRCTCAPRARFASAESASTRKPAYGKPTEKIAKRLSRAGLCSRRVGEEWIVAGKVSVDGEVVRDPATRITSAQKVTVDGAEVSLVAAAALC